MALSLKVTSYETDINVANNTSYVQLNVSATTSGQSLNLTGDAYINGTLTGQNNTISIPNTSYTIGQNSTKQIYSAKLGPFTHNTDGSLNPINISLYAKLTNSTNAKSNTTCTMSTIPRASTISLSSSNVIVGDTIIITIKRKSSSFTHNLSYQPPSSSNWISIGNGITISKEWTLTQNLISYFPTSPNGIFRIKCDTYNGDSYIGTSYTTFTLGLRVNIDAPNFTLGISEGNSTVSSANIGSYVQNQSKIKITFSNITKCQGSPLDSVYVVIKNGSNETVWYTVQDVGENVTSAEIMTNVITLSGQFTIAATVYDKRHGASIEKTATSTALSYSYPTISNISVARSNSQGVEQEGGTRLKYTFVASVVSLNNKNSKKYEILYKTKSSSSYTPVIISTSTYNLNNVGIVLNSVTLNLISYT